MNIIWISSVDSTNTYVKEHADEVGPFVMVCAIEQTAGRGQRGNSWESQPGRNLTFSFYINNLGIAPGKQFRVSEAVALAMVALLREYGIEAKVKWPNDVYVGDKKIAGILIENSIMGNCIQRSVVGIGLNVNQTRFISEAPNPVSMANITGLNYPLEEIAEKAGLMLERYLKDIESEENARRLHEEYLGGMWRRDDSLYPFLDVASGSKLMARIEDVEPTGHLILNDGEGRRRYAFKEVAFL